MNEKDIKKLFEGQIPEGPLDAGQTFGLKPEQILDKYFTNRNALLTILRIYRDLSLQKVSKEIGVSAKELEEMEKSKEVVPFQLVPKLAKVLKVDLKMLLRLLGHMKPSAIAHENKGFVQLGIAAQYSGPELTEQEKVNLEELFRMIIEKRKKGNQQ